MKKLKVKEIIDMSDDELEVMMSDEQFNKMKELGIDATWKLLELMQNGARESNLNDDDEYVTIDEYLSYIEDMRNN